MCPIDLQRSLGEAIEPYVLGAATLAGYRLGFYFYAQHRNCGALDIVPDRSATVHGVLYRLPVRLSLYLDRREQVAQGGYRHEWVNVHCQGQDYRQVRTYVVVDKLPTEYPPNDWYTEVVLRGAATGNLPPSYRLRLHEHIQQLQQNCQGFNRAVA
jgi:cation transport regulator ChaC